MLISAPSATITRSVIESVDPFFYTLLRFLAIAIACVPFLYLARKKITRQTIPSLIQSGLYMSIAVNFFTLAILYSQASYVSLMTLVNPILLVLFSSFLLKEKITHRVSAGVTLAAIGVMVIVLLPIAIYQGQDFVFYPLATVLALINSIAFTLAIIKIRQANEAGISMMGILGFNSLVILAVSAVLLVVFGDVQNTTVNPNIIGAALYTGLIVATIGRGISVLVYEHVGSGLMAGLMYVEMFAALAIPIVLLGEKLSPEMIAGGTLVLVGIYVMEHHKTSHAKHAHVARHL